MSALRVCRGQGRQIHRMKIFASLRSWGLGFDLAAFNNPKRVWVCYTINTGTIRDTVTKYSDFYIRGLQRRSSLRSFGVGITKGSKEFRAEGGEPRTNTRCNDHDSINIKPNNDMLAIMQKTARDRKNEIVTITTLTKSCSSTATTIIPMNIPHQLWEESQE